MKNIILVVAGGAVGTFFRYLITGVDFKLSEGDFPTGTLVVNITGSLIIGFLWGLFERFDISSSARMTLFIGVLGGYTTFSAFGLESFSLVKGGDIRTALMYIMTTNALGIASVFTGFKISRAF